MKPPHPPKLKDPSRLKEEIDQASGPRRIRVYGGTRAAFRPQRRPRVSLRQFISEAKTKEELEKLIAISQEPHILKHASPKTQRRWQRAIQEAGKRVSP
jgi:hypothetical protein